MNHLCLVFFTFTLSSAENIAYRNYQEGDTFGRFPLEANCQDRPGIPCYVAVDLNMGANTVVGFIEMTIPDRLSKGSEAAVRSRMSDPKKKGRFGFINHVVVSKDYRRNKIGTKLVEYSIECGKKTSDILALALFVKKREEGAIAFYETFHFINVMEQGDEYLFALYYSRDTD
ncbi:hypothetical protein FOL47_006326 [Perkinsus chesapeaki]|uniref:N-acetyltransferase domain-containing protein n=1 Tax=Perkinsus chesapeaki TaxID=330153 RepID=A0A7J6LSX0_PERCH|nr:hypothetical protein FOL47_006326 [Perkinsus chesapeaki]